MAQQGQGQVEVYTLSAGFRGVPTQFAVK